MRFRVEQAVLASGLQTVSRAVSGRTTLPILSGILLEAADDALSLSATDLEIAVRTRVPAQVDRPGAVVLPARYLVEYTRRIPYGSIDFAAPDASAVVTLRWDRSEYQIHGFTADQFPELAQGDGGPGISFPQALLRETIQQTAFAVSTDQTRPTLTGVHLRCDREGLIAIATDGFRVAIRRSPFALPESTIDVILPGRSLNELLRLLEPDDEQPATLTFLENQVHVRLGETEFISRRIDGQYPNVLDLLPTAYPIRARVDREALLRATDRAALLADSRLTARLIVLHLEAGRMIITSQDPEVGQAYEELPIELEGEGLQIGVNARYLVDGLQHIHAEDVSLEFIDPVKAIRVQGIDDDQYQYIVFPVRL